MPPSEPNDKVNDLFAETDDAEADDVFEDQAEMWPPLALIAGIQRRCATIIRVDWGLPT